MDRIDPRTCREIQDERLDALEARVTALEARHVPIEGGGAPASTATANQTYSLIVGDAWAQYTAAMDGPEYLYVMGYPQDDDHAAN